MDEKSQKILCTNYSEGKKHDLRLYRDSKVKVKPQTKLRTDSGYQGLQNDHQNTDLPKKKPPKKSLTKEEKKNNKRLGSERALNEHVIGRLKRFKVISERYRNRRKRFSLRFNLLAGIYNYEVEN